MAKPSRSFALAFLLLSGAAAQSFGCGGTLTDPCQPPGKCPPPPDPMAELVATVRKLQYEPLKLPRGIDAFDVGQVLNDPVSQSFFDNVVNVCVDKKPDIKSADGPSEISQHQSYEFQAGAGAGLDLGKLSAYAPNISVRMSTGETAKVRMKYTNIQVRQVGTLALADALSTERCKGKFPQKEGAVEVINSVLVSRIAITVEGASNTAATAEVGWKSLGVNGNVTFNRQADGTFLADTPIVFAFQTTKVRQP